MANRGNAAQQILERAPPEPHRFGYAQMLANGTAIGMVDVARPFTRIRIGATAQLGEEVEFQMVVRVDQAGKHDMAGEIEGGHVFIQRVNRIDRRGTSSGEELGLSGRVKERALGLSDCGLRRLDKLQVRRAAPQLIQRIGVILQFVDLPIAAKRAAPAVSGGGGMKIGEQEGAAGHQNASEFPDGGDRIAEVTERQRAEHEVGRGVRDGNRNGVRYGEPSA